VLIHLGRDELKVLIGLKIEKRDGLHLHQDLRR
jgi:hypothetical protein